MREARKEMLEKAGLTCLRELVRVVFHEASLSLDTHIHPDAMEICFLYRGHQIYQVDGQDYQLNGMDVFVTYPNEEHSSGGNPEEKSELYYLIVDCVHNKERFLGVDDPAIAYIPNALVALPQRAFRGSERIHALWEEIYRLIDSDHPLRTLLMRQRVVDLFLEILACAQRPSQKSAEDIQRAIRYIRRHVSEDLSIDALARLCGLSPSRFKAKFRQQTGMPPGEYVMRQRVQAAQDMLGRGMRITDVAFALGFSSSQYFATCFRRFVGVTPSQFCRSGLIDLAPQPVSPRPIERS